MQQWGRGIKLTAVCALVVLALTGFSTGSHGSSSGGSSGGSGKVGKSKSGSSRSRKSSSSHSSGGGCSSSSQDHDDYDDDDDDDVTYDDDTSTADDQTAMPPQSGIVTLVSCATKKQPYATVQVHNPNDQDYTFSFKVSFLDAKGGLVHVELAQVDVPANGTVTAKEYVGSPDAARVHRCDPDDLADPVTATSLPPSPSATATP